MLKHTSNANFEIKSYSA